jgi:C4-dicarboxylate-specific signal transduction histidine kinase
VSWWAALMGAAACGGWGVAFALGMSIRRRLSLAADAEHELRGAAAAIGLAAERLSRTGATVAFSSLVRLQLDRMAAGLQDLAAARAFRRAGWAAALPDAEVDAGRLAQVLGNLIANATEHGVGSVDVRTSRPAGAVTIEIRNRNRPRELQDASAVRGGRGRGLAIAERAARELGGRLRVESGGGETRAELDLPAVEGGVGGSPVGATGAGPTAAARDESTAGDAGADSRDPAAGGRAARAA